MRQNNEFQIDVLHININKLLITKKIQYCRKREATHPTTTPRRRPIHILLHHFKNGCIFYYLVTYKTEGVQLGDRGTETKHGLRSVLISKCSYLPNKVQTKKQINFLGIIIKMTIESCHSVKISLRDTKSVLMEN